MPRAARSLTVSIRSLSERPKRSSFHTTIMSPGLASSSILRNSGRSNRLPLILSVKVFSHCSFFIASICSRVACLSFETRIYPSFMGLSPFCLVVFTSSLLYKNSSPLASFYTLIYTWQNTQHFSQKRPAILLLWLSVLNPRFLNGKPSPEELVRDRLGQACLPHSGSGRSNLLLC